MTDLSPTATTAATAIGSNKMTTSDTPRLKRLKLLPLTVPADEWLEDRNVPADLAANLGVCSAADESGRTDWICFRNRHNGEIVHESYRTFGEVKRFRQSADTARTLWNSTCLDDATLDNEPLIITEGHMDALVAIDCGFPRTVSVPDGAPPISKNGDNGDRSRPMDKYNWIDLHKEKLKGCNEIILCGDGDAPGALLVQDLSIRLGKKRCKWVQYPSGCKDISDVRETAGVEGVRRLIDKAKWIKVSGVYSLDDLPDEPPEVPLVIGMAGLDDLWKVVYGRMTVVTGPPSHGKSQMLADALCHLAYNHGLVIAIASFEDRIKAMLLPRLIRWYLRGDPDYADIPRYEEAYQWVREHFIFIQPDEDGDEEETPTWYMEKVEVAVLRSNAKVTLIDPFNELSQADRFKEDTENDYVGQTLKALRRHAKKFNYHTIIAAHPKKMNEGGKLRIPEGYDISGSSNWFNKTDSGLTVFRDFQAETTLVRCWKAKSQGVIGEPGDRTFRYNPMTGRYSYTPELHEAHQQGRSPADRWARSS